MHKRLCLGVIEGHLIILLIKAMLTRTRLAVVFAFFGSPDGYIRALRFIYRFDIDLYPHDQNEVSSLKDFSKIVPLSLHGELFFHQLTYLS